MSYRKFSRVALSKDYYSLLGLKEGAQSKEIRSAYLSLAKKYHPDTATGNTEKFKQIAEAYQILSDPRLKQAIEMQKDPKNSTKKEKWQYNPDQNSESYEERFKDYEEWRSKKNRSYSERPENFEAHGYEYYDPYMKNQTRYTYSKFKRDRYNQSYRKPEKNTKNTTQEKTTENNSSGLSTILTVVVLFTTVNFSFRGLN